MSVCVSRLVSDHLLTRCFPLIYRQVKTVYEMTIHELSESSLKANQDLSEQLEQERAKWQAHTSREGKLVQEQVGHLLLERSYLDNGRARDRWRERLSVSHQPSGFVLSFAARILRFLVAVRHLSFERCPHCCIR